MPTKNNWILKHGDLIPELENYRREDLPLKLQLNIKRAVCRIEIVKWNSKYDMRYELFNRLNTGGAKLTDQEIRNCIFRGVSSSFNEFLCKQAKQSSFINLIGPTEKQIEELYLDELVLRFCSLYNNGNNVRENISNHMSSFMKKIVSEPERIKEFKEIFDRTFSLIIPLGKKTFRATNNVLSTSLYDGITIGIAQNIEKYENRDEQYLESKINRMKNDEDFRKTTGSAANSKTRVLKRLKVAHELFEKE